MKTKSIILLIFLAMLLLAAAVFRLLITRDVDGSLLFELPSDKYFIYRLVPMSAPLYVCSALGVSGM